MSFGVLEVSVVLLVMVLLFGARALPELARGLGQARREFREAQRLEEEPR